MAQRRKTGGRQAGTPNKATVARHDTERDAILRATADLTPEMIQAMTPLQIMERAAAVMALAGLWKAAADIAADAAPYRHAKLAPATPEPPPESIEDRARRLHELQKAMRETIGATAPLDPASPPP